MIQSIDADKLPMPGESLPDYLRRLRLALGLTQKEVADKAGIHWQSLGKFERGKTGRLNRKTKTGLGYALEVPSEYFEAIARGISLEDAAALKFCPRCWQPGTAPDAL